MRGLRVGLSVGFLVGSLIAGGGPVAASAADLVVQVDGLVRAFPGDAAVYVADPNAAAPLYTHEADQEFLAASLYKLGILIEVETRVDAGTLGYDDAIEIGSEDITDDGSFEPAGTVMTIDEALESMITVSDNGTALAFWRLLGPAKVDATLERMGLGGFHVALDDYDDNTVTARAVGELLTQLARRRLVSPAASDRMLARLERQQVNDRLPAQLPPDAVVAHKTGNLGGVTHDAGIVFTPSGPRIVVGLTANAAEDEADQFLAGLGSLVYAATLEPPANARFQLPKAGSYETGAAQAVQIGVTNAGIRAWTAAGAGSVRLIWELRDATGRLVDRSPTPVALPALAPNAGARVTVAFDAPRAPGDYTLVVGLADPNGTALAGLGAATGSFGFHVHEPYLVATNAQLPSLLHRREASLLILQYSDLPAAGGTAHTYQLFWQAIDPQTDRPVASGSATLGTTAAGGSGTFFAPFDAPALRGTYELVMELRENGRTVSERWTRLVEIAGPRTFPDDRQSTGIVPTQPRPSGSPRPSPGQTPRGRSPSPTPTPSR
ncbi:MAG TPA: serine hydrolase [Candidatus Limnocylindria bacterium]